jgi:hypothetical protein
MELGEFWVTHEEGREEQLSNIKFYKRPNLHARGPISSFIAVLAGLVLDSKIAGLVENKIKKFSL